MVKGEGNAYGQCQGEEVLGGVWDKVSGRGNGCVREDMSGSKGVRVRRCQVGIYEGEVSGEVLR